MTETPEIYANYVRPYMQTKRDQGRLNWVFNIIEGRTEQENVLFRSSSEGKTPDEENFLLLPDLNWDRKTMSSLHLLALVERRDIWSVRDLKTGHVEWLKRMLDHLEEVVAGLYGDEIERDMLKFYVHCEWSRFKHFLRLRIATRLLKYFLTKVQINPRITTSTSTLFMSAWKLVRLRPWARRYPSRTSSANWQLWVATWTLA